MSLSLQRHFGALSCYSIMTNMRQDRKQNRIGVWKLFHFLFIIFLFVLCYSAKQKSHMAVVHHFLTLCVVQTTACAFSSHRLIKKAFTFFIWYHLYAYTYTHESHPTVRYSTVRCTLAAPAQSLRPIFSLPIVSRGLIHSVDFSQNFSYQCIALPRDHGS